MIFILCRCSLTFPMHGNLLVRESMGGEILLIGPYKILTGAQLPPLTY